MITVGAERFRAPEALFQSQFLGPEQEGIHKLSLFPLLLDLVRFTMHMHRHQPLKTSCVMIAHSNECLICLLHCISALFALWRSVLVASSCPSLG